MPDQPDERKPFDPSKFEVPVFDEKMFDVPSTGHEAPPLDKPTEAAPKPGEPKPTEALPSDWFSSPLQPTQGMPPAEIPTETGMPGSITVQEPGITQPRPPTVGEARARDKARKRAEEARAAAAAALTKRRRRMRGTVAVVGVAAVVGAGYLAYDALSTPSVKNVNAQCIQDENGQQVVVDDSYCGDVDNTGNSTHYDNHGHLIPIPIPIGGGYYNTGGHQYRYYYGGNSSIGSTPHGGSFSVPSHANVTTSSGHVVRGGFGSHSGSGGS